jgi:hypothetical protein
LFFIIHVDAHLVLYTGALNHITGEKNAFAELEKIVSCKVRFGDGSLVDIREHGTVLFAIDN